MDDLPRDRAISTGPTASGTVVGGIDARRLPAIREAWAGAVAEGENAMVAGFAILLTLQLLGEVTARGLGLPVPGPVLGMAFLVVGLAVWVRMGASDPVAEHAPLGRVADGLLGSLAILFVPAGVGVVQYLDLIAAQGMAIVVTLVISTVITMLATVATFRLIKRAMGRATEEGAP